MEILFHQYDLIRERRNTLFGYCESLAPDHFVLDIGIFGNRSICYLMVHVANTYRFWLGHFADIDHTPFAKADDYRNVTEVRTLFEGTNILVDRFLKKVQPDFSEPIVNKVPKRSFELTLTPLQLYTQVITHEYHHKGQILSMSRQLGYTPIDTDIIRFD